GVPGARGWVNQPVGAGGAAGFELFWVSDAAGAFALNVPEGSYNVGVFVGALGLKVLTPEYGVTVAAGGVQIPQPLVFEVEPADVTISGTVRNSSGGAAGNALVTLTEVNAGGAPASPGASTRTDVNGVYSISVQTGKRWRIGAFVPQGGAIAPQAINSGNPLTGAATVHLALPATQTLVGWVKVGEGGLSGVQVTAQATDTNGGGITAVTDASGNYQLALVRPASGQITYPIQVWAPQLGIVRASVAVDSLGVITCAAVQTLSNCGAGSLGLDITSGGLRIRATTGAIAVILKDAANAPFTAGEAGATAVSAALPGNSVSARNVQSMSLPLLTGGTYTVTVAVSGFGSFAYSDVAVGSTVTVTLPVAVTLKGRISDGANGLDGAVINVSGVSAPAFGVSTTSCGATVTAGCAALGDYAVTVNANGSYTLTVSKPGYLTSPPIALTAGTSEMITNVALGTLATGQRVLGVASGVGLADDADVTVTAVRDGDLQTVVATRSLNKTDCPVALGTQYCLNLPAGTWRLTARADGFATAAA
ncbi:MAG: hypothetical protein NTZ05_14535, partial [Chloroflexi bacterium]|nr:hypothetical protein [Chloroflexota bacterium]